MGISTTARANLALGAAAFFWGSSLIFQRQAMEYMGPMAFNGLRFLFGGLMLLPLALVRGRSLLARADRPPGQLKWWLWGGLISGGFIFVSSVFQQYGLTDENTTAGKAGFITSLYVVLVPLLWRLAGRKITSGQGLGAALAVIGLYFLSISPGEFRLSPGDGLVLISSFFWAGQILVLGWLSPKMDALMLTASQLLFCGLLGAAATVAVGQWPTWAELAGARTALIWVTVFGVVLAYGLQVIGQKNAQPTPAAIIMQMESVVAAAGGWLLLNEIMSTRMIYGAILIFAGLTVSQLWPLSLRRNRAGGSG